NELHNVHVAWPARPRLCRSSHRVQRGVRIPIHIRMGRGRQGISPVWGGLAHVGRRQPGVRVPAERNENRRSAHAERSQDFNLVLPKYLQAIGSARNLLRMTRLALSTRLLRPLLFPSSLPLASILDVFILFSSLLHYYFIHTVVSRSISRVP
ncbi:hypothetical protein PMAYCL1PPCAC_26412, partial [Pristionchus mayeri]